MQSANTTVKCYHCGEDCDKHPVYAHDKNFCCEGCKMVYEILETKGLCNYYSLNDNPGITQKIKIRENKFAYLEDSKVKEALISFSNEDETHVTFYLPQIHCSSCLWLLENLYKIQNGIISAKVNFPKKEVSIVFQQNIISLKEVAETLTKIGYEPYISLQYLSGRKNYRDKSKIYKLGVAGFCFGNIMLLSFPEYLGVDVKEPYTLDIFRWLSFLLSLPVFFYSATEFYKGAWKSLKHGFLNIDAPVVLAILVTFFRSIYELFWGTGAGYFDSLAGIVFFMLIGRILQDRTYAHLNFDRDYTDYFPLAVTRIKNGREEVVTLPDIKLNDTLLIHNNELIPADGIITRGEALIDYSFVTGESFPVKKEMGEVVYAGGKQTGGNVEIFVIKEVAQSYLTGLWNKDGHRNKKESDNERSFVHLLGRNFTLLVLLIAVIAGIYWGLHDPSKIWTSITAILIIACPCALLLSSTYTNGNILRILSRNFFYLRNAQTIEDIANTNFIVFDKTGTLTSGLYNQLQYHGKPLSESDKLKIVSVASQSTHPMCKAITTWANTRNRLSIKNFEEISGSGLSAVADDTLVRIGARNYVEVLSDTEDPETKTFVSLNNELYGCFIFKNQYRPDVFPMIRKLQKNYPVAVMSGDNKGEENYLRQKLGEESLLLFQQSPKQKLQKIEEFQYINHHVMMLGDGLNDSGALQQANVGIAVTEDTNYFTPSSDAILKASELSKLENFIQLCKGNKKIILFTFAISIIYNITGLYFAVRGMLSPMIAAILMPCSSISIILLSFGLSNLSAYRNKLLLSKK